MLGKLVEKLEVNKVKFEYYQNHGVLILADCMDIFPLIENDSIDLVLADPPYNISEKTKIFRDYRSGASGDISFDFGEWDYNFDPIPFLKESKRVLNQWGSVIVWTSEQLFGIYRNWFAENMHPKQMFVWVKDNPLPQFRLIGYRQATELIYWASKNKITQDNPNFIFDGQKEMTNVFMQPIVSGRERVDHPTQKPLKIHRHFVRVHCRKDGIVLDPFLGSGTTFVACVKEGRKCIGIEKEEKYYKLAKDRIENEVRQLRLYL